MADPAAAAALARAHRLRWWTIHALQLVLAAPVLLAGGDPRVLWPCALLASVACCLGTDSGWRWRNRLLVAEAAAWLSVALVLGV